MRVAERVQSSWVGAYLALLSFCAGVLPACAGDTPSPANPARSLTHQEQAPQRSERPATAPLSPEASSDVGGVQGMEPAASEPHETQCEPAEPNPHGIRSWEEARNTDCLSCPPPSQPLPACAADQVSAALSKETFQAVTHPVVTHPVVIHPAEPGQVVSLKGILSFFAPQCTALNKSGCGCPNKCGSALQLFPLELDAPPHSLAAREPSSPPSLKLLSGAKSGLAAETLKTYVSPSLGPEPLSIIGCYGDDGTLCCPFDLERQSGTARVIATGTIRRMPYPQPESREPAEYGIELHELCRVRP